MRLLLLIAIVALNVANFEAARTIGSSKYPASPRFRQLALNAVTDSASAFSTKFFETVGKNTDGNLVCSPISASMVLSMAAYGARGNTEMLMRQVLNLPRVDTIAKIGFQTLVDHLATYRKVELRLANKMYSALNVRPGSEFNEIVTKAFRSDVENLDFRDAEGARNIINNWCAQQTNDRIKDIISPGDINDDTALVLVNAVYFKGMWLKKFEREFTLERDFYVDGKTMKKVPTMHTLETYGYGELSEAKAKFVELPYSSEDSSHNVSMFVILPNEKDGLAHLQESLVNINVKHLLALRRPVLVDLALPKFEIDSDIPLEEPLTRMGLGELFDKPDFSGIVPSPPLRITKFVQKAAIAVDEEGSEASAATSAMVESRFGGGESRQIFPFVADHPFVAIIATTNDNPVNLFTVRYTGNQ